MQTPDFVLEDDIDAALHKAIRFTDVTVNPAITKKQGERKIYERKASESLYSEELEFHQYRKKKLQDLDKKSKHLLLFSNIN
jgi:transaldolase